MAGSAQYTAVLDACVLYPAPVRDILLSLGSAGLFHARWTAQIQDEWVRNLLANRKDIDPANLAKTCSDMARAIPDCLIENHLALVESLQLPDLEDRHVLAAAIVGHADAIVTMNLKDFPADILEKFNLEAQHPDDFILNQLELHHFVAVAAIKRMRSRLKNPSKTAAELILTLENCQLTQTAAWLRNVETLI